MTNLSEKLEQLSAAATQGEWISIQSSINPDRHYITNEHHAVLASEIGGTKPDDLKFVTSLVNLYRTGQLVAVQAVALKGDAMIEPDFLRKACARGWRRTPALRAFSSHCAVGAVSSMGTTATLRENVRRNTA